MKHNVILQAIDPNGSMKTWEYFTIKSFLVAENHIHSDKDYKFHKAWVDGIELNYSDKDLLLRDVSDFKTYCRKRVDRKEITMDIPKNILIKFLLEQNMNKRNRIYKAIQEGKSINDFYNNGGGGMCEYRPGYISGYCYFKSKGVEIEWINDDADVCRGMVSRGTILSEIRELINQGIYLPCQVNKEPKISICDDKQLAGQMSIYDWLATS